MRKDAIIAQLRTKLEEISGIEMMDVHPEMSFIEVGLDSLLLTQIALILKNEFEVPISFRQLNEELSSLEALGAYICENERPGVAIEKTAEAAPVQLPQPEASSLTAPSIPLPMPVLPPVSGDSGQVLGLLAQQVQLIGQQIALMSGQQASGRPETNGRRSTPAGPASAIIPPNSKSEELSEKDKQNLAKPFGAIAKIETKKGSTTQRQEAFIRDLQARYTEKTKGSKAYTQKYRAVMADPRVVSGFRPLSKELTYPIVCNRSAGSHLWDIDGNKYIDLGNGFGSNMLGYQPDFIKEALHTQIEKGFEIGPQHELAGQVSELIHELTGHERVGLCNTGSEAVLGAMRIVRTVSGKPLIVTFSESYHGIHDEVLVRGTQKKKTFPAAPGILPEAVKNILVLEYGNPESLEIIRQRAGEIAAVLVEPVQSRNPELQPVEFVKSLRELTRELGTALIFDEVITGFRIHPQGAQGYFGVKADLATYGKVVGGGMSIGVIAGSSNYMDALDGGFWQYGDDSIPEAGVTYFAGTFVRHPLALAAAKASLEFIRSKGQALCSDLNEKSRYLTDALNQICTEYELPIWVARFGSVMKVKLNQDVPNIELLYVLMREKGIHIQEGFPLYMTLAHTTEELDQVIQAFKVSVERLIEEDFFPGARFNRSQDNSQKHSSVVSKDQPPVPNARLGKDAYGNPAWFIEDPERNGKYLQVEV